ncbi:MAG: MBL fold metallo-hydrolase [Aerococcaceae bacterium]|nr:MBL fold metallo-hydrolase [Aerococcaceae bacterium]
MITVHRLVVGAIEENCYCLVNENKQALIIDPGNDSQRIKEWIIKNEWQPQAILLTHCHFDHIGAVDVMRDAFGIEAYVHPLERDFLTTPALNLSTLWGGGSVSQRPAEKEWHTLGEQRVGDFSFRVAFVPGHSPGHVMYIFDEDALVVSGDLVFKRSVGRTDLPQGDFAQLMQSIEREVLPLPHHYVLYTGHGDATTIAEELAHNPYFEKFR